MTKPTGKKRGRPRKLPEFAIRFGEDPKKWNEWLFALGLPMEKGSTKEILECDLRVIENQNRRGSIRRAVGESLDDYSVTQPPDWWLTFQLAGIPNENVVLSAAWLRYLEYMYVIAEQLSPKDNGANLKKLALDDAWSRFWEKPLDIPAELGAPEEFKRRLADHELEIRCKAIGRAHVIKIRVYPLPPDVDEDLDETEEPKGHWEGLKWFPDGYK